MKRKILHKPVIKPVGKGHLKEAFINLYLTNGNIQACCKQFQINSSTYYDWLKADKDFKEAMDIAKTRLADNIEEVAMDLAINGQGKPIMRKTTGGQYEQVGEYFEKDPKLIMFMLQNLKPNKYTQRGGDRAEIEIKWSIPDNGTQEKKVIDLKEPDILEGKPPELQ